MVGTTVSHYHILAELGRGGMGVVYKAEDTKLNRTVALKFLPTNKLATDEDQQRFEQEAKAAAQLSHAHIATVYEINEHEGETFIAMEYLDGETLADKIKTRPLKLKQAVTLAGQIAEGLHAAHEQGIVHRDVKSANIMVTARGDAKIMDFGLAKMSTASMLTKVGTTVGTISYMSPEQSRGEAVDHRSDIWSLGVVLYEMISGQLPFKGDYEQAVVYAILNSDPEPLTALRTGVPMELERIVSKLLAKEPEGRYQHIIEVPVDLKQVSLADSQPSQSRSSILASTIQREKDLTVKVNYSYRTVLTALIPFMLAVMLTWILKPGPPLPAPKQPHKMVVPLPESTSFLFSFNYNRMAISPDGRDIVYLGSRDGARSLFVKRAGSFEVLQFGGGSGARAPFFSPDGQWIGYVNRATDEIYKVLVDGGEPLKVTSDVAQSASATWAPDNTIIFSDGEVLKQVPESGGAAAILTKAKRAGERHLFPHVLPDGKTVLFTVASGNELSTYRLAVYRVGDDDYRVLVDEEGYNAVYSPSGHILYGRSERLMAVPFDLKTLAVTGLPVPVLDNVQTHTNSGSMSYALSGEGTLVYVPGTGSGEHGRSVLTVDLSGQATPFFDQKREFDFVRYSPDGNYVAFAIEVQNTSNIWIYGVEGEALNQLTFYEGEGVSEFAWSPDSKILAYAMQDEDATNSIYTKRIDGIGGAQKIYTSSLEGNIYVEDWSRDGDKIAFDQVGESTSYDLFVYSFQDSSARPYLATPVAEVEPNFSPNGKWMAYVAGSDISEVYVKPYPERSGGLWKISNGDGRNPVWSPDGTILYFRGGDEMYAVDVTATDVFSKGTPRKVFEGDYAVFGRRMFDIHPDGERFIMMQRYSADEELQEQQLFVIQNFSEDLKRLVPVSRDGE